MTTEMTTVQAPVSGTEFYNNLIMTAKGFHMTMVNSTAETWEENRAKFLNQAIGFDLPHVFLPEHFHGENIEAPSMKDIAAAPVLSLV